MTEELDALVRMTRALGKPKMKYVIIGEGNTSCLIDEDSFWIKASGQQMHGIGVDGFVGVRLKPILELLETPHVSADDMKRVAREARLDPDAPLMPSIEVTFHAALLADCGVRYIAHTHPVAVNQIMCSPRAEQFAMNRMFPDEAVLCGPRSVFVPYADPGLPLAIAIRERVAEYMDEQGEAPKVILLANHGLIALGQTPTEALNVTAMCVKAAEIFIGACAAGGPVFMTPEEVMHIYKRPDEIYRRRRFVGN
ncbi:MAG: class II aldolase/adducin family protein [Chloroflexota bacterium]|nr:MAG: aldolase [Chloroflexota bacterium]